MANTPVRAPPTLRSDAALPELVAEGAEVPEPELVPVGLLDSVALDTAPLALLSADETAEEACAPAEEAADEADETFELAASVAELNAELSTALASVAEETAAESVAVLGVVAPDDEKKLALIQLCTQSEYFWVSEADPSP